MRLPSQLSNERGMALASTLLALLLILGLMVGAFAALNADLRSNSIDRDQSQAYAAAHAGLEQLTSDLASLFMTNVAPTVAQINALTTTTPNIPGFEYVAPGGDDGSGYAITWNGFPGTPVPLPNTTITAGPLAGFKGLLTPYTMTVTARSTGGGAEVRLRRELNTVAVPVFQFGVFSEGDLTFYSGDDFNFGGRVHTNGHLFLSGATSGNRLSFSDKITAVGDVVRQNMSNGQAVANGGFTGTTQILVAPPGNPTNGTGYVAMTTTMGSITGMPTGPVTLPPWATPANAIANWPTYSNGNSYFKGNIKNRFTGATILRLPIVQQGANPIDLIRRSAVNSNEDTANPLVYGQRFFAQASVRILLSDRVNDISQLPTITAGAPIDLNTNWNTAPPAGYVVAANRPPLARSVGTVALTISGNPGSVAANNWTIHVNAAIPAQFSLPPQISVQRADGTFFTLTCNATAGKSGVRPTGPWNTVDALYANRFIGCSALPEAVPSGRLVTATTAGGGTVTTTTNTPPGSGWNAAGATTLTVVNNGTAAFTPIQFFTHNPSVATSDDFPTLVSCTGFAPGTNDFLGCTWNSVNAPGVAPAPNGNNHVIITGAMQSADQPLIGGFIKIERQDSNGGAGGTWTDVTAEILGLGIGAPNQEGVLCADPTPDAILRIQRLKDNGFPGPPAGSTPAGPPTWVCPSTSTDGQQWWPNTLYDTREGALRNVALTAPPAMGGAMQYIALDMRNLKRWLNGEIGVSGPTTLNRNGYIVYFSDRRGDHNENVAGNPETGKYGNEDIINRNSVTGAPNGVLDQGEDVDGWGADNLLGTADDEPGAGTLDQYGRTPWFVAGPLAGAVSPYDNGALDRHETPINSAWGRVNRVTLFRRALKLVNGGISGGVNNLPTAGLTIASENPVYVQGNYNSLTNPNNNPDDNATQPNVPASIIADSVTLLSNNWTDARSFRVPNDMSGRQAANTGYRFAVVAGKNVSFPFAGTSVPGGTVPLFGTDGGMGNFLRLLEDWNQNGNVTISYRGSMISLFNSRQGTGVFKYGTNVYDFGVRNFQFDSDFLIPALLPPGTPMFRDVNTLNFRQMLRPTQ